LALLVVFAPAAAVFAQNSVMADVNCHCTLNLIQDAMTHKFEFLIFNYIKLLIMQRILIFLTGAVCALHVYADDFTRAETDNARSAYVNYLGYSLTRAYIDMPDGQIYYLFVPRIYLRYTFYNPADIRVKAAVYVPGSPFTDKLFGTSGFKSGSPEAPAGKTKVIRLDQMVESKESALREFRSVSLPESAVQSALRASSGPDVPDSVRTEIFGEFIIGKTQNDTVFASFKQYMEKDAAVAVWESEPQFASAAAEGSESEAVFSWDYATNRNNIVLPVNDYVYYVLKNADTDEILHIMSHGEEYRISYSVNPMLKFNVDTEGNTRLIAYYLTNMVQNCYFFLLEEGSCVEYVSNDAIRKGPAGILEEIQRECPAGALAAGPEIKDGQSVSVSVSNAYTPSYSTWNIKTPDGRPFTALNRKTGTRDFYLLMVNMSPTGEMTVGREIPETRLFLTKISLPDPSIPFDEGFPPGYPGYGTALKNIRADNSGIKIYGDRGEIRFKSDRPATGPMYAIVFTPDGKQIIRQAITDCLNGAGGIPVSNSGTYIVMITKAGQPVSIQKVVVSK
jgi:hypothetical protein